MEDNISQVKEEFVFYYKKKNTILLVVVLLIFISIEVWMILHPNQCNPLQLISAYGGIPIFGLCLIVALGYLFHPRPIVINKEGFSVPVGLSKTIVKIKWSEVKEVTVSYQSGQRHISRISITARNPEEILARASPLERFFVKGAISFIDSPFAPCPLDKILQSIEKYGKGYPFDVIKLV
ncbi:MAG: STM3941 family protein [bacterium]|nr:STM3941 family protein [bacterium]